MCTAVRREPCAACGAARGAGEGEEMPAAAFSSLPPPLHSASGSAEALQGGRPECPSWPLGGRHCAPFREGEYFFVLRPRLADGRQPCLLVRSFFAVRKVLARLGPFLTDAALRGPIRGRPAAAAEPQSLTGSIRLFSMHPGVRCLWRRRCPAPRWTGRPLRPGSGARRRCRWAYGSAGIASGGRDCPLRPADLFVCDIRRCRLRP